MTKVKLPRLPRRLQRRPAVLAILIGIALWVTMAAVAAVMLWRDRERAIDGAMQVSAALIHVMEAHTARTFQTVDLTLAGVVDALLLKEIPRHDPGFRQTLRKRLLEIPHVRAIYVIGPDGHILHDTDFPSTPEVSLADRGYFIRHRNDPDLVSSIAEPAHSRSSRGWFIASSRRIGRDGEFKGIVVAAVQPRYFESLYRSMGLEGLSIALFHQNGLMVARHPPAEGSIGRDLSGGRLFSKAARNPHDTYIAPSDAFARQRVVSYGTLDREPLLVALYQEFDTILADWHRNLRLSLAALACLLLLVALSVVGFIRHDSQATRQRQRRIQQDKLEALGRLTGGTAHDFANLLGVVNTSLELVARYAPDDRKVLDAVAVGKRAVASGTRLIDQMLAFAKDRPLKLQTLEVNALISSRAGLLRHAAGSGVSLTLELGDHLPACRTDETQLETALVNLVVNARDALGSRGNIRIRTQALEDAEWTQADAEVSGRIVCITVQDDGPGMTDEAREHLFEPFFTTKGEAGHGFGLPQIYGFTRQAGGDIRIETAIGAGTSVHLSFPAVELSDPAS